MSLVEHAEKAGAPVQVFYKQYRCHGGLSNFPGREFYNNMAVDGTVNLNPPQLQVVREWIHKDNQIDGMNEYLTIAGRFDNKGSADNRSDEQCQRISSKFFQERTTN
jgi:hypothetical protein